VKPHSSTFQTRPFLKIRRAYGDLLAAARTKDVIHGLVEIDVTDARQAIAVARAAGEDISFTAYLLYVIGRAVDEDRTLHAYRRRRTLIIFDEVDANTQIEATVDGQPIVKSVIIRSINHRSIESLTAEIRAEQTAGSSPSRATSTSAYDPAICWTSRSPWITRSSTGRRRRDSHVGCRT